MTFWITPAFGFSQSHHLLAALNGICALSVFSFVKGDAIPQEKANQKIQSFCSANRPLVTFFFTGLLGIGYLYTREHFRAVRRLLSGDGIFCQWLPLYQMDLNLLRLIMRTFLDVFPEGTSFLAHHSLSQPIIGLIGGRHAIRVNADAFDRKIAAQPDLAVKLRELGLSSIYTLLGCYLAGGPQLREFAGPGPVNTDDQPRVLFQAPEFVYASAPSSSPADRIMAVVEAFEPRAEGIVSANAAVMEKERLKAYWQARNDYLQTGRRATSMADLNSTINQLAGPLLKIVHVSPDFEAAYRPLLVMAARLHSQNPRLAEKLLMDLEKACPNRPEAGQMRMELVGGG